MPRAARSERLPVPDPTAEIARLYGEFQDAVRTSIVKAIRIGELLTALKPRAGRAWEAWVEANLPFTPRWASTFMRVYREREQLEGVTNIKAAVGLLANRNPTSDLPPADFPTVDEDIEVDHICPSCGYAFSGGETRPRKRTS